MLVGVKCRFVLHLLPQPVTKCFLFQSYFQNFKQSISLSTVIATNKNQKTFTAVMSEALDKFAANKEYIKTLDEQKTANAEEAPNARSMRHQMKKRKWVEYSVSTTEDSSKRANFDPSERIKRKKTAIVCGYSGANYYGMQRNPGMKTIEEELFKAMLKQKWISDDSFEQVQNACFQRAARTDKGVSAARQVCSIKLPENLDIATINADLPDEIRIFGALRVTKGFNAKDQCNARTYTYTMPTAALGDHNIDHNFETFRLDTERINKLNEMLALYKGTKNFHNFTSRKGFLDPSAKRYIMSFTCSDPFLTPQGIEFVTLKVKGQSFMLHQIRKMVGLVIAIVRGNTSMETFHKAFTEERIDLPMAPGLGLVLDTVHYERYNDRYGTDGIHKPLTWAAEEAEINAFIQKYIFPKIYDTEFKEKTLLSWVETLSLHSYAVRQNDSKTEDSSIDNLTENGGDDNEE